MAVTVGGGSAVGVDWWGEGCGLKGPAACLGHLPDCLGLHLLPLYWVQGYCPFTLLISSYVHGAYLSHASWPSCPHAPPPPYFGKISSICLTL